MKKLLGLWCLVSAALALLSASALAGTVSKHSFYSSVLEREMVYNLYVPDSYDACRGCSTSNFSKSNRNCNL